MSSIGIGTYRGRPDDGTDRAIINAVIEAVRHGLNVVDTSINYRDTRSESCVGAALRELVERGIAERDGILLCTKGGYLPLNPGTPIHDAERYLRKLECRVHPREVVNGCHLIHPAFLRDQLRRSLTFMQVDTIDLYYLHNPEVQLREVPRREFEQRLLSAFEFLEAQCHERAIARYGLATWHGFRVPPAHPMHLDLRRIKSLAARAAGGRTDHLHFVQGPFNLAMPELVLPLQERHGRQVSLLEVALELGVGVVASASIGGGQCLKVPLQVFDPPSNRCLRSDPQRALQFTRSVPGIASALVGMKTPEHLAEITALASRAPLSVTELGAALN